MIGALEWIDRQARRPQVFIASLMGAFVVALAVFLLQWLEGVRRSQDGLTTATGARTAVLVLLGAAVVGIGIRSVRLWAPRAMAWWSAGISIGFLAVASILFTSGRLDLAYSLYGGLQVLRSDKIFSDTHWVLSWFECDLCERWDPHYGPTLSWLEPATGGNLGLAWLVPLGLLLSALGITALWLLVREASHLGRWTLVVATVSPAWLLLVDRANADIIIFGLATVGIWLAARSHSLWGWSFLAAGLWVLGTIKYFPFAMGAALLLALSVRRGWTVVLGFLAASFAYVGLAWDSYQRSSVWNSNAILVLGDFPAYGRIQVVDFLVSHADSVVSAGIVVALLILLVVLSSVTGWGSVQVSHSQRTVRFAAAVALGGSLAFIGKVLWGGFGFLYTGAFLMMVAPILLVRPRASFRNGVALMMSILLVVSIFTAYNTVLATVTALMVAGYGLGAGLRLAYVNMAVK